jgi:hypothetical protein
MFANFSFWIWFTIIMQVLTAIFHSISFFAPAKPRNDTEKQLVDLVKNYKMDMGAGIKRSFGNLFVGVSTSFTLIYIFGALINWYFLKEGPSLETWHGFMLVQMIIYGLIFVLQLRFTFLSPIIVTGLVFIGTAGTYFFGT